MKNLTRIVIIGGLITISLLFYLISQGMQEKITFGGVNVGNDYNYTRYTGAASTTAIITDRDATLGTIVVLDGSGGDVTVYDATSTTAYSITNATTVGVVQASVTDGTSIVFDAHMKKGLVLQYSDSLFNGDYLITHR